MRCVLLGLIFNLYFASLGVQGLKGRCEKAENCCKGRNSACVVNGLQSDGSMVDEPCYCDEGCLETGDCCHDYKRTCNAEGKSDFMTYRKTSINVPPSNNSRTPKISEKSIKYL